MKLDPLDQMKESIGIAVFDALTIYKLQGGEDPSDITVRVRMEDVSTTGDKRKRYVIGAVDVKFNL